METDSGVLDEALQRLHATGPEFDGWLSNHAPMAVEALTRHGHAGTVHRWVDRYRGRLDAAPRPYQKVTSDCWREALGDPRRLADWTDFFIPGGRRTSVAGTAGRVVAAAAARHQRSRDPPGHPGGTRGADASRAG